MARRWRIAAIVTNRSPGMARVEWRLGGAADKGLEIESGTTVAKVRSTEYLYAFIQNIPNKR